MGEVIFKFNDQDSEDKLEIKRHSKVLDLLLALNDLSNNIRGKLKYSELSDQERKAWNDIQDSFYNTLDKYSIDLEELII